MSTNIQGEPAEIPRPPLYEELERQVKALTEENRKLRADLEEARRKNQSLERETGNHKSSSEI